MRKTHMQLDYDIEYRPLAKRNNIETITICFV